MSHLIVILDWWSWGCWLSDPVEDLVIVLRVVNTLWPWSSPGVTVHVDWNSLSFGLEGHHIEESFLTDGGGGGTGDKCNKSVFHYNYLKLLYLLI